MVEAYFSLYAAGIERCENEAEDVFQRSENKKSPRPWTDPEDCTRFFILACSPALEGTMVLETSTDRSLFQAGLLAHGSSYSPCLPIYCLDSGVGGFRPHLQRRDREGFAPSSLTRKPLM
jgi:hypothetical protein